MTGTRKMDAAEIELRQSITLAVNSLAEFKQIQQRLGWLGWLARIYANRDLKYLSQYIKDGNTLLALLKTQHDILDILGAPQCHDE